MYAQTLFNQQSYTGNVGTLLNFIYKNGLKFLILIPSYILVVYVCDTILRNLCYKSHIWKFFRGRGGCLLFSIYSDTVPSVSLCNLYCTHQKAEIESMSQYMVGSQKGEIFSIKLHRFPYPGGKRISHYT